ncbi:MAG: hypothetical protein JNL10_22395 [Verrucomicrobiales bacterium]|nr:hypothetical protein [Verrucomicrobiales bacterium]
MKTHFQRLRTALGIALALAPGLVAPASAGEPSLAWTNNLLTWRDPRLPGGKVDVWYLEAFLRPGAHDREWGQTVIRHRTELSSAAPNGSELQFRTRVEPDLDVSHRVGVVDDGLQLEFTLTNRGTAPSPVQWFQPACIRVAGFTGADQEGYLGKSWVFTPTGLTLLKDLQRTSEARYRGGQVFLPPWTAAVDANPRPIAGNSLTNGLIGCFSEDGRWILATASDHTHELFEGVYVCLHSDPRIAGVPAGGSLRIRQKIYLLTNDVPALLKRYQQDFPARPDGTF